VRGYISLARLQILNRHQFGTFSCIIDYVRSDQSELKYNFNHLLPLISYYAHVKSVKHTGLVSFVVWR